MADLQGPKLRVGKIEEGTKINQGDYVLFSTNVPFTGNAKKAYMNYQNFPKDVSKGERILLDDGKLILKVTKTDKKNEVEAIVIQGGAFKSNKGVNLPNTNISLPALTEKDIKDAKFIFTQDVDWIALSFIQSPEDVKDLRKICKRTVSIMAKIEKPTALNHINKITKLADGLMIARGDLGVELPIQDVPGWQKRIIREARIQGKPVIVSTQMLESMIISKTPTRAEVSDVATAVFEGSDAVMLSAESAIGDNPELAVKMMDKIAHSVEKNPNYSSILSAQLEETPDSTPDAIATAARSLAKELNSPIIVCYTESGSTGIKVSRVRPKQMILTVTPIIKTARKLTLVWGVKCIVQKDANNLEEMIKMTKTYSKKEKIIKVGEKMVITAGLPLKKLGTTNLIRVIKVD